MIVKYGTPMTLSLMDEFAQRWCHETSESGGVDMWDAARDFTFVVSIRFILGVDVDEETSRQLRKDFDLFSAGLFAPDMGLPVGPFHEAKKARKRMDVAFAKILNEFMPLYNAGKAPKGALYVVMEEAKKGGIEPDVKFVSDQMMNLLVCWHRDDLRQLRLRVSPPRRPRRHHAAAPGGARRPLARGVDERAARALHEGRCQ